MKIFITWSGDKSLEMAFALRDWLKNVIQVTKPFVSEKDICMGSRWFNDISNELDDTHFGIVCVTPGNKEEPWLNFESGALGKSVKKKRGWFLC